MGWAFYVLCSMFSISMCLVWYGSQSEAAGNRCLWLRTILRLPVFPLWVVGSYFLVSVFVAPCRTVSLWVCCFCSVVIFIKSIMITYHAALWSSSPSSYDDRYKPKSQWTAYWETQMAVELRMHFDYLPETHLSYWWNVMKHIQYTDWWPEFVMASIVMLQF